MVFYPLETPVNKQKIIFLDCDGVLNNHEAIGESIQVFPLDDRCVERFLALLHSDEQHKVVLSSSWRHYPEALRLLTNAGIPIYDLTDSHPGPYKKGHEINDWVVSHEEDIFSFVIVDDNADLLPQQLKRLVQTTFSLGLQDTHINKMKMILSRPLNEPVLV